MKKALISLSLVLSCLSMNAQMTRWIMQPGYDKIYIASGAPLLISDSLDTSSIWSIKGKKIAVTNDVIHPFKEGLSVTTKKNSEEITGFFNSQGKFTSLKNYSVTYDEPFFRDGFLLVQSNNRYCFININGEEERFGYYVKMYPFNNGFATCFTYEQVDKLKNPYYTYVTADNSPITFSYNNKVFDKKDVEFLSSVNDEGVGIAIIKHKVYLFDKNARKLEPVFANKTETNIKRQVSVDGELNEYLMDMKDSIIIRGKGSKTEFVRFNFDKFLRPTKIYYADRTEEYKHKTVKAEKYSSPFSPFKSNEKYGLNYKDETVLPEQFDEIGFCLNDFAVVRIDDKWGMLTFDPNLKYRLIMHNGKDIAFRHKDVATTIKLELPVIISADKCRFDVDEKHGCIIDKISLETKNTENGNYVQYNCNLTIPDSLPDVITEIQYPVQITYDGLKYPIVPIKTKAWHYKYINVDLDETETTLEQGNVSFTINISADKQPGENDYPFEVEIKTDSLQTELAKISETRYKCKLFALAEGINNVNINILENGCPPSVFPFEITYIKPVKKSRNKPEVKEEVKIEKKVKAKEPAKTEGPILPI
ncbi:WG repeat-containing protein [Bacteroides sp.]|uniref:WG repeat-containing protein n=1 Tax=Bacteroides sp. TaxID=29523 RepID=UPI002585CF32|nr:WG repeat-containing protein [Bacteroides sp.]